MSRRVVILLLMLSVGLVAAPASAKEGLKLRTLEFSNLNPPIGTRFVEGAPGGAWSINAPHGLEFVMVHVASSPAVGSDGHTLSNENRVAVFSLYESSTVSGFYKSVMGLPSYLKQGRYWWQIEAVKFSEEAEYQTAIHSFVVAPKRASSSSPAPGGNSGATPTASTPALQHSSGSPLTLTESYAAVKEIILIKTRRHPRHLRDHCRRINGVRLMCNASWTSTSQRTSRTFIYAGAFNLEVRGSAISYRFRGFRERASCVRRFGTKHCETKLRWHS